MINIKDNLDKIKAQIQQACQQSDRLTPLAELSTQSSPVSLLAVSKTKPASLIEQAYMVGQHEFGENYLQEAVEKIAELSHLPELVWHFIGPIQSNKTKQIASNFSWVHSIDREKIALRLNQHLKDDNPHDTPLNICLQVNISGEITKSGVLPQELPALLEAIETCENL